MRQAAFLSVVALLILHMFMIVSPCYSQQAQSYWQKQEFKRMGEKEFLRLIAKSSAEISQNASRSLVFGGFLPLATNGNPRLLYVNKNYLEITFKMIDMLEEAGVDAIIFYIDPYDWKDDEIKTYYDRVIKRIKEGQKRLFIGYQGSEPGNSKKYSSYDDYKETQLETIKEIAERYNPDYFSVVVEPITMERWGRLNISDEQWISLVLDSAALVKKISPETQVVAATTAVELDLLNEFAGMESVDILGINPYREALFTDYIVKAIDRLSTRKPVYITEIWISGDSKRFYPLKLEADFLRFAFDFTQRHNICGITPFFSKRFITASLIPNTQQEALYKGERTSVFYAYKEFISKVKRRDR